MSGKPEVTSTDEHLEPTPSHGGEVFVNDKVGEGVNIFEEDPFMRAMELEPPQPRKPIMFYMYFCCLVGILNSTTNGFDGMLMTGFFMNPTFKKTFGTENIGAKAAIINAMYQIGGVASLPFMGPFIDTWGRRRGMQIGSFTIIAGVIISGTTCLTGSIGQFLAGRFFLGFGISIAAYAAPIYIVEISHPAYRGLLTGLYNVCWFTGGISANIANRFCINMSGAKSWTVPLFLQMVAPGIIFSCCFFIPESPRWLFTRNKFEAAKDIIVKFYGLGDPNSVWVKLQLNEYEQFLNLEGADKRWWDYRALFRNRTSIYRLCCTCLVDMFCQWAGNGVVSYYLSALLDTVGYTNSVQQLNINIALTCIQFAFAIFGATLIENLGRRYMLVLSFFLLGLCWIPIITGSALLHPAIVDGSIVATTPNAAAGKAALGFVFIFDIIYAVFVTPLNALYPIEVLSFEMRAKGGAFSNLFNSAVGMISQFAIPIGEENIQWRLYIFYMIWCECQSLILYFLIPETKGFTLEELDQIFESKNPVQAAKRAGRAKRSSRPIDAGADA